MSAGLFADPAYDAGLERLAEMQRTKARLHAQEARELASLTVGTMRGWQAEAPRESVLMDVAGTCEVSQLTAGSWLDDAEHLVHRLPGMLALLETGELLVPQARVLITETRELTADVCAEIEQRVLPTAAGRTPARLREKVRRVVQAVDAEQAAQRATKARADRKVWTSPAPDGMTFIGALAPAVDAARLMGQLTARAKELVAAGDDRTLEQLRADLLCDWQGTAPDAEGRRSRPVQVVVHVPVATALGLSDEPGRLEGYGPLEAGTTRQLLADAELRKACVDSHTGRMVAVEDRVVRPAPDDAGAVRSTLVDMVLTPTTWSDDPEPQHDPSASLSRLVRWRDVGCDGPGCGVGSGGCDGDHHSAWPDGPTTASNLVSRSPRCHHAKHTGWTPITHGDGSTTWRSPGGRTYLVPSRDEPPPRIRPLEPDDDDAPPWVLPAPEQDQPDW